MDRLFAGRALGFEEEVSQMAIECSIRALGALPNFGETV
jgi:hypothetical protein